MIMKHVQQLLKYTAAFFNRGTDSGTTHSTLKGEEINAAGEGERQAAQSLSSIREDHRGRYEFALRFIPEQAVVLDAACGVGYGAFILATRSSSCRIVAIDRSTEAIAFARKYYSMATIDYMVKDCISMDYESEKFDVVVCFETIEHIQEDQQLLKKFYQLLKPQGTLLCSTPNQDKLQFSRTSHPFHHRHYTPGQFETLLRGAGFSIAEKWSQHSIFAAEVSEGWDGFFNIAVCKKVL